MSTQLTDISVYLGDIHGTRLEHLSGALTQLQISPSCLLCTMDLDQVLSIQDLLAMQLHYEQAGKQTLLVPGNHEAAIIHRIGIDSSTYRKSHQNTSILELVEALNLPSFSALRASIESTLEIKGGAAIELSSDRDWPGLLIHGAMAGKEEKYLSEFPPDLQDHVRARTDLWLRLETDEHLRANFEAMRCAGVKLMLRGHDHYLAMRSLSSHGALCSYQLAVNIISEKGIDYRAESPRSGDDADDMVLIDSAQLGEVQKEAELFWHEIDPKASYVINCGPFYQGCFGLIRAGADGKPPAVAFCETAVSLYNEHDRRTRLGPFLSAHQARSGKTFYELFPHID